MDCLAVPKLPAGPEWTYEIKLDGYRLEAVRSGGKTTFYSRRHNVLTQRFPYLAAALESLPAGTVIDGELVALGRPETVARIDFLEWTSADHLRHTKFVALREDKNFRKQPRG